ncbi:MAG: hypothetical protein HC840_09285 [Leptolyngbyaceae cyanobacterium RM2_2_4]|nr:hypothetical protein [Leptolyngbyaceae cyanobacterium SM1_4_3]NJO49598.1 hypothetical protein [Leptolyngbyaceae cyanobacterium RM2_2_4]
MAGVNDILRNRFRDTSIQERLFGKTGTASGIVTLAGYLELPDYQPPSLQHFGESVRAARANHSTGDR